jgi:hypothetical protein
LDSLPPRSRSDFAAACAERLARSAERDSAPGSNEARRTLEHLWEALSDDSTADLAADLLSLESLGDDLDQDHCAATAYAMQALSAADAQEAEWAAQRAFATAFDAAVDSVATRFDPVEEDAQHPSVQAEYLAQTSQLVLIERGALTGETLASLRST